MKKQLSKRAQALNIYLSIANSDNKRIETINAFKSQLDMTDRTAATYFHYCEQYLLAKQAATTERIKSSGKVRVFSAVKPASKHSDIAKQVELFTSRKAAENFNQEMYGFKYVLPGIVKQGSKIA